MACIKLLNNRTFWIIIILLNKTSIQISTPIQISENGRAIKTDPAHVYIPPSEGESSFHPSSRPIAPCLYDNAKTAGNNEMSNIPLKCTSETEKQENYLTTISDQSEKNSLVAPVMDLTGNARAEDRSESDREDVILMMPYVKEISENDREDVISMTQSVKDISENDREEVISMTQSVKHISENDREDVISITPSVKYISENDREDVISMTQSVKEISVDDREDVISFTPSVKEINVDDREDVISMTPSVKEINVDDREDVISMTPSVKEINVDDREDVISFTPSVKEINVDDREDVISMTPSVKEINVDDRGDVISMTPSVKEINVDDREDVISFTPSVKEINVDDREDVISMTPSVKEINVDDREDVISMTPSVKEINVDDREDVISMTPSVKEINVDDREDVISMMPSVKEITVDARDDVILITPSVKEIAVDDREDVISITPSVKNITKNDVALPSTLLTVPLSLLYHMIWCIQVKLVKDPPVWPYDAQYMNCRSPILSPRSKVMTFTPSLIWLNNHKNTQVTVARSFLRDILWCSLHEFDKEFMLFSFDNLLKLCERTKQVVETIRFDGGVSVKPEMKNMFSVIMTTYALYHIVWCVQNESLSFNGLPISYPELKSCKSPLFPFNNESIQGTKVEWWGTPASIKYKMKLLVSLLVDILKCAEKKVFGPDDMSHPDNILRACEATKRMEIIQAAKVKNTFQRMNRSKKQLNTMKPFYICVGLLALILGSLGNFLIIVTAVRRKLRQTSTGIYLFCLSIIDIVFLYMRITPQLHIFLKGRRIWFTGNFVCKTIYFFTFYVDHLSAWIRLCFTIERMFAVALPYIYRAHFKRHITVITLLTCSVTLAGFNSYSIFLLKAHGKACIYYSARIFDIFRWVDVVLSTIIPFIGIMLSNSIMLYSLWRASRQRQHMTGSQSNIHKITILCVSSSFCFVLSTAPIRIYVMTNNIGLYYAIDNTDVRIDILLGLDMCRFVNSTISFLVYWLSGSIFRKELAKLFKRETTDEPLAIS